MFKNKFLDIDKDRNGTINIKEFEQFLKSIDQKLSKNDIKKLFNEVDTNGSNTIDLEEFVTHMASKMKRTKDDEKYMRDAFQLFDKDGNGFINAAELRKILIEAKKNKTYEEVKEMIRTYDTNGDGHIDYEEFVKMMNNMNV